MKTCPKNVQFSLLQQSWLKYVVNQIQSDIFMAYEDMS
jgi:hypothetical protein